ncbi:prepilin peptidase [Devriesea agamarum]|uniref:prepilin peptidase n=1 Tax=Devriesea agamarum TaxID=472569 RepID=UPI00071E36E6|nr:prepilin peptidase [Devriesea agamarum]
MSTLFLTQPELWPALAAFIIIGFRLTVSDWKYHRLPFTWNIALIVAGALLLSFASLHDSAMHIIYALITAGTVFVLFNILFAISRGNLGFGDVILTGGLSLYTGYISLTATFLALWCGSLITLGVAIGQKRRHRESTQFVAYGPGLIIATCAVLVIPGL